MADKTELKETLVETSSPDVVTEVIDLESTKQDTGEVVEGKDTSEKKEPEKATKTDTTKAFSERLNKAREKDLMKIKSLEDKLAEYDSTKKGLNALTEAAKKLGYTGTPEEIARKLRADNEGKTVDEILAEEKEEKARYEEYKKTDPDFLEAQQLKERLKILEVEELKKSDYSKIKNEYPDIEAKNFDDLLKELGKPFLERLAKGYDPIDAYETTLKTLNKQKKDPPPSVGSTKSSGNISNNELFSRTEYEEITSTMSDREKIDFVKKNYDKVMKSKKLWK